MYLSNVFIASLLASALQVDAARSSFHSSHARRSLATKRSQLSELLKHRDPGLFCEYISSLIAAPFVSSLSFLAFLSPLVSRSLSPPVALCLIRGDILSIFTVPSTRYRSDR